MIRIITDSASDITCEEAFEKNITILPMRIQFGETSYLDKYDLSADDFYTKLTESNELPTTSMITPYTFTEEFKRVKNAGDSAVVILMSSGLSGTVGSALAHAADFDSIYVVDTKNVAVGEYCLVSLALRLRDAGYDAVAIAEELTRRREDVRVLALLDTLEYLKKGGRISTTTAWAGGLLSIKPVVAIIDGKVQILGKARGSKSGNNLLIESIQNSGGIDFTLPISLGYSGLDCTLLNRYIEDSHMLWEDSCDSLPIIRIGSTIGTHIGPGAIAVAFFSKH